MAKKDTTPKVEGVSDGEDEPIETTPIVDETNPARRDASAIAAKARALRDAKLAESGAEPQEIVTGSPEPESEPAPGPGPEPEPEPAPAAPAAAPANEPMVTVRLMDGSEQQVPATSVQLPIRINGQDRTIPATEGIRGAQMVGAGQENLRIATMRLREAERREAEAAARQSAAPSAPAPAAAGPDGAPTSSEDLETVEIARALQYGSEEEAAEALRKLQRRDTSGATSEDLMKKAISEAFDAERRYDAEVQSAEQYRKDLNTFATEYKDVVGDENMRRVAANYTHAARAATLQHYLGYDVASMASEQIKATFESESAANAIPVDNLQVLRIAGQATRDWADTLVKARSSAGQSSTVEPSDYDTKRARKAATNTPPAGASQKAPVQHVPARKTPSEKIAEIREQRKGRLNPRFAQPQR